MNSSGSSLDEGNMKPNLWYTLYFLSELGAHNRHLKLSTSKLAKNIGFSQQTASRHLIELEKDGYITKSASLQGVELKITENGMNELRRVHLQLKTLFEGSSNMMSLEGTVFSGLGEGGYYVGTKGYKRQFLRKLGFDPYPGTLNLKLVSSQAGLKRELETYPPLIIEGFGSGRRTFGQVKCYPATINDAVEGAVVIINRTHYDDAVLELIAPMNLRKKLKLNEGSSVQVKVFTSQTLGEDVAES